MSSARSFTERRCLLRAPSRSDGAPQRAARGLADGVVKLEFATGQTFVLNRQTAAHQMWFAAGASAWHYDWDAASESWLCDKDGHELLARIGEATSGTLGRTVAP